MREGAEVESRLWRCLREFGGREQSVGSCYRTSVQACPKRRRTCTRPRRRLSLRPLRFLPALLLLLFPPFEFTHLYLQAQIIGSLTFHL